MRADTRDYRALFLAGAPMMDTRAPIEFAKGAFPGAVNLPLMSDAERHKVGTCYKQRGQEAAIALGHQLVSGAVKDQRIAGWADFARAHPEGFLYCFRGGLRSQIVQQWLAREAGIAYPRVLGGYKAMRGFLLETLQRLANGLDLEAHARHRGSSFGKRAVGQPAQIDFENALAIDVLRRRHAGHAQFVVEDEGQAIGSCSLPADLFQAMRAAPLVWLEDSLENRIGRILRDYVIDLCAEFEQAHGQEAGRERFALGLRQSLDSIAKRLGGERHRRLAAIMDAALAEQRRSGAVEPHREWIAPLLAEYYDPMYAYQRQSKAGRIVFAGDRDAVLEWLRAEGSAASRQEFFVPRPGLSAPVYRR